MGALYDLLGFSTTTTGTGTITAGPALTGLRPLSTVPDGTVISYSIKSGSNYETGTGTVGGTGTTLTRTLRTSSTGSLLNLSGTSEVRITPNAGDFGGGSPAGSGTELQVRNGSSFGAVAGSSWTSGTTTLRLPANTKLYLNPTHNAGIEETADGYGIVIRNRYGSLFEFYSGLTIGPAGGDVVTFGDRTYGPRIRTAAKSAPPSAALNVYSNSLQHLWLIGNHGGGYASSSNAHNGAGVSILAGYGATPTTTNANGGDAGNFDVWLNPGGAGNGTGAAGARGKLRVINDSTDAVVWSVDQLGNMVQSGGTFRPAPYTTATRPAWQNGAVFFDSDLDKLVIGGASAWEVVTSA
jgi:hypothetical protein